MHWSKGLFKFKNGPELREKALYFTIHFDKSHNASKAGEEISIVYGDGAISKSAAC